MWEVDLDHKLVQARGSSLDFDYLIVAHWGRVAFEKWWLRRCF